MAKQVISLGSAPSGAGGDDRRSAWLKAIANFDEIYSFIASGYQKGNILGTVAMAAGVPSGSILQRGSNANGEYVRFADGTQVCWSIGRVTNNAPASGYGDVNVIFPIAFPSTSYVVLASGQPLNHWDMYGFLSAANQSVTGCMLRFRNGPSGAQQFSVNYIIIGRWY